MAYWLEALIFPDANLDCFFASLTHAHRIRMPQHLCLLPIIKELRDEIAEKYPPTKKASYQEMDLLSRSVIEFAKEISRMVPVAYIEATYTGGYGGQSSIVWKDGEVVLGPLVSEKNPEPGPINEALRFLGVSTGKSGDEFATIGLHLHSWTKDWLKHDEGRLSDDSLKPRVNMGGCDCTDRHIMKLYQRNNLKLRTPKKKLLFFLVLLSLTLLSAWTGGTAMNAPYLGSEYKGNYVWGLAMNLAWNELNENILHEKLKMKTDDAVALAMVDTLNHDSFTKIDLDEKSYYIKSGFGQKTVELINKASRAKFPGKSFEDLKLNLGPKDIISYAYFLKQVEYLMQFMEKDVLFEKEKVKGFYADDIKQKENVKILKYWDDNRFIISLKLKDESDELILAKGFDMNKPQEVVDEINRYKHDGLHEMGSYDQFAMPKLHLDHKRNYVELMREVSG